MNDVDAARDLWYINRFVKERKLIERIKLVGPTDKRQDILYALAAKGYSTVFNGAYTNKTMFPKADDARFLLIAEREVTS